MDIIRLLLVLVIGIPLGADTAGTLALPSHLDAEQGPGRREHLADKELVEVHMPVTELHPPSPIRFLRFKCQFQLFSQIPMLVPFLGVV